MNYIEEESKRRMAKLPCGHDNKFECQWGENPCIVPTEPEKTITITRFKRERIEDRDLLDQITRLPCLACPGTKQQKLTAISEEVEMGLRRGLSDPDHVTTRGAGGDDVPNNVWPLCREHHMERHRTSPRRMAEKYPGCMAWLLVARRNDALEAPEGDPRFSKRGSPPHDLLETDHPES